MQQPLDEQLIHSAQSARNQAYAPYSLFTVGAALRTRTGQVFVGANVENVSFSLTMCAERVALGSALQASEREFDCLAIVSASREPIVPCGACRQVLAEFAPALRIISSTLDGKIATYSLAELLPIPRQGILD